MPCRPASRALPLGLGAVAGLLNVNFVLEWLLDHRTPISTTVVSDLAAAGRPWFWLFRAGDVASALALLGLCAVAWRRRGPAWRAATVLLAVFALSTLVAVVVPEHCPGTQPAVSGPCAGDAGWADVLHDVVSTAGTTCGIAAAAVYAWAVRRRSRAAALAHLAAAVVAGGLGLAFVWAQATGEAAGGPAGIGWVQRAQIVALSAWFVVVGWSTAPGDAPPRAAVAPPAKMRS